MIEIIFKLSMSAALIGIGPWNINDPYWVANTRPQAESGTDKGGRHTNKAGIDLSPAVGRALDIDGKGTLDWWFETTAPAPSPHPSAPPTGPVTPLPPLPPRPKPAPLKVPPVTLPTIPVGLNPILSLVAKLLPPPLNTAVGVLLPLLPRILPVLPLLEQMVELDARVFAQIEAAPDFQSKWAILVANFPAAESLVEQIIAASGGAPAPAPAPTGGVNIPLPVPVPGTPITLESLAHILQTAIQSFGKPNQPPSTVAN